MIRRATLLDVPRIVELGALMHAESRYTMLRYDAEKMARATALIVNAPDGLALVAVKEGRIVGAFMGVAEEHFFSRDKFAFDLATYIEPAHRGGFLAVALLRGFVRWARARGIACINAGIASGINHDVSERLYERVGFVRIGTAYEYQGNL